MKLTVNEDRLELSSKITREWAYMSKLQTLEYIEELEIQLKEAKKLSSQLDKVIVDYDEKPETEVQRKTIPQFFSAGCKRGGRATKFSDVDGLLYNGMVAPDGAIHFNHPNNGSNSGVILESKDYSRVSQYKFGMHLNEYKALFSSNLTGNNHFDYNTQKGEWLKFKQCNFAATSFSKELYSHFIVAIESPDRGFYYNVYDLKTNKWEFEELMQITIPEFHLVFQNIRGIVFDYERFKSEVQKRANDFIMSGKGKESHILCNEVTAYFEQAKEKKGELQKSKDKEAKRKEALNIMRVKLTENERINQILEN